MSIRPLTTIEKHLGWDAFRIGSDALNIRSDKGDIDIVVMKEEFDSLIESSPHVLNGFIERNVEKYFNVPLGNSSLWVGKEGDYKIDIIVCEDEYVYSALRYTITRLENMVKDGLVDFLAIKDNRVNLFQDLLEFFLNQHREKIVRTT